MEIPLLIVTWKVTVDTIGDPETENSSDLEHDFEEPDESASNSGG